MNIIIVIVCTAVVYYLLNKKTTSLKNDIKKLQKEVDKLNK